MIEAFEELFDFDDDGEQDNLEKKAEASFIDHISVVDKIQDDVLNDLNRAAANLCDRSAVLCGTI